MRIIQGEACVRRHGEPHSPLDWLGPEAWAGAPPPALLKPVRARRQGDSSATPPRPGDFGELEPLQSLLGEDWYAEAGRRLFAGSSLTGQMCMVGSGSCGSERNSAAARGQTSPG